MPKKRANKRLARIPLLETVIKSDVAVAPMNSHKYRNLTRIRGKNFEPNIAEAAMPKKYAVNKLNFSVSSNSSSFTIVLKLTYVNTCQTKLLSTRRIDGAVSLQAVFFLIALIEIML